jgi:C4-dicarboxylate-specific signal transduction histidine kinase
MTASFCVAIAISYTGAGMSSETLERVFAPFYTTKGRVLGRASASAWLQVSPASLAGDRTGTLNGANEHHPRAPDDHDKRSGDGSSGQKAVGPVLRVT